MTTASGKLVFGIFAALAEFERELLRERTLTGLQAARARGRKGGRKFGLSKAQVRLGQLVEYGLAAGYQPLDFGLERISVRGEVVTAGLKTCCQVLFGLVQLIEGYGMDIHLSRNGGTWSTNGLAVYLLATPLWTRTDHLAVLAGGATGKGEGRRTARAQSQAGFLAVSHLEALCREVGYAYHVK